VQMLKMQGVQLPPQVGRYTPDQAII